MTKYFVGAVVIVAMLTVAFLAPAQQEQKKNEKPQQVTFAVTAKSDKWETQNVTVPISPNVPVRRGAPQCRSSAMGRKKGGIERKALNVGSDRRSVAISETECAANCVTPDTNL